MHPRIQEVLDQLDAARSDLAAAVASVPVELCGTRPAEDRWSVAEIVEHLTLVEARIARVLDEQLAAARSAGPRPEAQTGPTLPTMDMPRLLDRTRRLTASASAQPSGDLDVDSAWALLEKQRDELRDAIRAANGIALSELVVEHARLGRLNMYQWLIFLAAHERRHTAQVLEVAETFEQAAR